MTAHPTSMKLGISRSRGDILIYYAASLFLLIAPLSLATGLEEAGTAKYARILATVLIVLIGIQRGGLLRLGAVAGMALPFAFCWTLSPLWSASPFWGLFYKSTFLLTFLSGLSLATTAVSVDTVCKGLRIVSVVSLAVALLLLYQYRTNPMATATGRLSVYGLNPNLLAEMAASLIILTAFVAAYDSGRWMRRLATAALVVLLTNVILTGSRGGFLMTIVGCTIVLAPKLRSNRAYAAVLAGGIVLVILFADHLSAIHDSRIFSEATRDTRSDQWLGGLGLFQQRPLFGLGWLHSGNSWATFQTAYVQILVETGILGVVLFLLLVATAVPHWWATSRRCRPGEIHSALLYLSAACVASVLVHGLVEASMVLGTSYPPLLLGYGVGLLDMLSEGRLKAQWEGQKGGFSLQLRDPGLLAGVSGRGGKRMA